MLKRSKYPNCRGTHHTIGKWYPPTPTPYPARAAEILAMFVEEISWSRGSKIKTNIEDARMEVLLRSCWIIAYRESIGEEFPLSRIRNHIRKALRFCNYKQKENYNQDSYEIKIGCFVDLNTKMTDVAQAETLPDVLMSGKKRRFQRC
jgi:hypothetical protein